MHYLQFAHHAIEKEMCRTRSVPQSHILRYFKLAVMRKSCLSIFEKLKSLKNLDARTRKMEAFRDRIFMDQQPNKPETTFQDGFYTTLNNFEQF